MESSREILQKINSCLPDGSCYETIVVCGTRFGQDVVAQKMASLQKQAARHFIISGHKGEAIQIAKLALDLGLPLNAITLEVEATNTLENVRYSIPFIASAARESCVGIIAKDYSTARTYLTATKAELSHTIGAIPYSVLGTPEDRFDRELVKMALYFQRGHIADPALVGLDL